jgi:hypothetical protein
MRCAIAGFGVVAVEAAHEQDILAAHGFKAAVRDMKAAFGGKAQHAVFDARIVEAVWFSATTGGSGGAAALKTIATRRSRRARPRALTAAAHTRPRQCPADDVQAVMCVAAPSTLPGPRQVAGDPGRQRRKLRFRAPHHLNSLSGRVTPPLHMTIPCAGEEQPATEIH